MRVHQPVTGVENALLAGQRTPVLDGHIGGGGLAESVPVQVEHRITGDDQRVGTAVDNSQALAFRKSPYGTRRVGSVDVLIDPAHDDVRAQPGTLQDAAS